MEGWRLAAISTRVLVGADVATFATGSAPPGDAYGLVRGAAVAIEGERIAWVGPVAGLPSRFHASPTDDLGGALVTPALVDCHTHCVYAGNRAREFELRLEGASYEAIARAGGGIRSTVAATRAASEEALLAASLPRVDALVAEGIATLEIKSGYGLDLDCERRMLRVAREIGRRRRLTVRTTFLGAHALPPEWTDDADGYVGHVAGEVLPALVAEGLVDAVDAFCEGIAFSPPQVARVFDAASALGVPVKIHAEQLSDLGGARLAAGYGALSADHLEHLAPADAPALAAAGTVAVLLPGAFYTLREARLPPVAALREAGVPIAIATDCNPGSSPLTSPLLVANMACTLFRLTPAEALAGLTREGARALGMLDDRGTVEAGKRADLAVWDVHEPAELAYRIGFNPLRRRIVGGVG
ncbi:MAG: imidazolonepropionase [Ectothiorhodospiraceae bacterium]|nr:imidazolonepropionase [Ectothiorhodospiraceae bacterium]